MAHVPPRAHNHLNASEATFHGYRTLSSLATVDIGLTLQPLQRGAADPSVHIRDGRAWLAFNHLADNAYHPVTLLLQQDGRSARADVWSEARHAGVATLASVDTLLGIDAPALAGWAHFDQLLDAPKATSAGRNVLPFLLSVRHKHPGLRLPATGRVVEELFRVVLEQKVTHDQARAGWRWLVRNYGTPAPATGIHAAPQLKVPPTPAQVLAIPSWAWHQGWVQPQLARTMRQVAERALTIERASSLSADELAAQLQVIPGVGPWTMAEVTQRTHGSGDQISVGDWHLAHHVGEFFTGRRTDDAGMVKLLEPFRPHRHRVVRLMNLSGTTFSRFGPRLAPADYRKF